MTIARRLFQLVTTSLRYRLLVLVLLPVLLVMITVTGMAYFWSSDVSYQQLLMKVNTDLSVVHNAFEGRQKNYLTELTLIAESYEFRDAIHDVLDSPEPERVEQQIQQLKKRTGFDFVQMRDQNGCDYLALMGCETQSTPLIERAAAGGPTVGVEIFSAQQLAAIDAQLAERVYLPLLPTPHAEPTERKAEDRAMVIHMVYPIRTDQGEVKAYLAAGVMVNSRFEFVDSLRDLVYGTGSLVENSRGTVTVFIDDVRINTNVPSQPVTDNDRALGTHVSQQVREHVLGRGETWIDRAFVVSDWYISAYEPIIDVNGVRVGMLYAGFLEAPFTAVQNRALQGLIILFLLVTAFSMMLAATGAEAIFRPIGVMAEVMRKLREEPWLRIGDLNASKELNELAHQFDSMLDQLQWQRQEIQSAADDFECKVTERTLELEQRSSDLQKNLDLLKRTRQQLVGKEKLAAIGELSAGMAHEINNPTAVILGNMDLLMAELGDAGKPVRQEANLIIEQIYRIRGIVNNLLQYSLPSDYMTAAVKVDINNVINDTMTLVRHDLNKSAISVNLDLKAAVQVGGNHQQLQQVLINLIVNAIHAMNKQEDTPGKLTIRSRNWRDEGVLVTVRDNGCGIDPHVLPRIFDPFFSRSKTGTGLGLSVSFGILERFGAEIQVRSKEGFGSCFYLWLRIESEADQAAYTLTRNIL